MITTNGIEECPCLHGALVKEIYTPFTGANGSFKEFDVAVGFPRTSLKVSRRKVLDHCVCRHHFRSVARLFQPDSVKTFKGGHEYMDGLGLAKDDTDIQEEGFEVNATWVLRFCEPRGFQDA